MKAFAGLAVTAGLIVAIPVANAQTWARHDVGKSHRHAASHFNRPYFVMSLQTMFRRLMRPKASMPHIARHSVPVPPHEPAEVAAGPAGTAAAAQTKAADAASGPSSESTGAVGKANPPTPQILPTQDMPAVQGLE